MSAERNSHDEVSEERIGFIDIDEDDSLQGAGLVAKDESGHTIHGPSSTEPGRYVLVRETEESDEAEHMDLTEAE